MVMVVVVVVAIQLALLVAFMSVVVLAANGHAVRSYHEQVSGVSEPIPVKVVECVCNVRIRLSVNVKEV
jgi:curli biogenesis system outer membrane secretion channel CsgG